MYSYIFYTVLLTPVVRKGVDLTRSRENFPGANPICLSLLFLPFTAVTVITLSVILRGEGVIYPFPSNDFIPKAKISFCRVRELNNKKKKKRGFYSFHKLYCSCEGTL